MDYIYKKIEIPNKFNILVTNFNVLKTGCLLIELLSEVGDKFDQLKVRCQTMREKIETVVSSYLMKVSGESEMRYLLLEKDIEDRDALDLISKCNIPEFLKSQFAENVVKEIWRSPYATNDSIYTASTNYFMLF